MNRREMYTLKSYYRRLLMQFLIENMVDAENTYDLRLSIFILVAVNWIVVSVKQIKDETDTSTS